VSVSKFLTGREMSERVTYKLHTIRITNVMAIMNSADIKISMVRQAPFTITGHTMFIVAPIHHETEKYRATRLISNPISACL